MKILYLKLKNVIGIFAGLNKYSLELDFRKSKNNIIMLFGGNGSGKSTILSALNPFANTTNDDRDKFFIEGKEGYKEIHYKSNNLVYIIKHYVSPKNKTKSFIGELPYEDYEALDDVTKAGDLDFYNELNENGGVTTFKEVVKRCLDVDEEFFKISRIGSNVTNFIDLSPANRKKFISAFLPNIDAYLTRYKTVNEKYKYYLKEIKYLADELTKLGDSNDIVIEINKINMHIGSYSEKINSIIQSVATNIANINNINKQYNLNENYTVNPYEKEFKKLNKQFTELSELSDIKIEEIDENIKLYTEKLTQHNTTKEILITNINFTKEKIVNINKAISKLKSDLNNIKDQKKHLDSLQNIMKKYNTEIALYERQLKDINVDMIDFDRYNKLSNDDLVKYSVNFAHFKEIIRNFKNTEFAHLVSTIKDIYFNNTDSLTELDKRYRRGKKRIDDLKNSIVEDSSKLSVLNENLKYKDILQQRPKSCKINSCSFISEALKYKNIDKDIEEISKKIENNRKNLDELESLLTMLESEIAIIKNIEDYYNKNKEFLLNVPLKELTTIKSIKTLFKYILDLKLINLNKISMQGVLDYKNAKNEIEILKDKLENVKNTIIANKNVETMYNNIIKDIETNESEKSKFEEELNKHNETLNNIESDITKCNKKLAKLNDLRVKLIGFAQFEKEYKELEKKFNDTNEIILKIKEYQAKIEEELKNKKNNEEIIEVLTKNLDDLKIKKSKIKEYNERKKNLDETFELLGFIKDALNPTKGIPVYFSKNYLTTTRDITNSLLDISQQGKFLIDFDINDKEFLINVFKNNGDKLNDIKLASQGETALTSLSLSLALIEQSLSKYNIFLLDELDGALDDKNRRLFIDMVNLQMGKLNSEQVFIISHNNEFYSHPVDLILLKDNNIDTADKEFMINKNIIFNI